MQHELFIVMFDPEFTKCCISKSLMPLEVWSSTNDQSCIRASDVESS